MDESKVITVKEKLAFIAANIDLIQEYQIKDIYLNIIRERIKEEYGISVDTSLLNQNLSYQENWGNIYTKIIAPKFKNIEEYKFFQTFEYSGKYIWKIENENENIVIHTSRMPVNSLIYVLLYVILNEIDENFARVNQIEKGAGFDYNTISFNYTDFGFFTGVQIKKLKNGTVTIKGLNKEQEERLNYLYTVTQKKI